MSILTALKEDRRVQLGVGIAAGVAAVALFRKFGCGCCGKPASTTTGANAAAAAAAAAVARVDAIVISGPSGVGKGTIIKRLTAEFPQAFGFSVSHTTRAPRAGEVDGKDYHFTTKEAIQARIANGEFLESCEVHTNIYGTSKAALAAVRAEGKLCIIEMDVQGAQKLKEKVKGTNLRFHYIFITAPLEELEKRIVGRGADTPDKVAVRLETAKKEFAFVEANAAFFDSILINNDLEETYKRMLQIVQGLGVRL